MALLTLGTSEVDLQLKHFDVAIFSLILDKDLKTPFAYSGITGNFVKEHLNFIIKLNQIVISKKSMINANNVNYFPPIKYQFSMLHICFLPDYGKLPLSYSLLDS